MTAFLYACHQLRGLEAPDLMKAAPEVRAWIRDLDERQLLALTRTQVERIDAHIRAHSATPEKQRMAWFPLIERLTIEDAVEDKIADVLRVLREIEVDLDEDAAARLVAMYGPASYAPTF